MATSGSIAKKLYLEASLKRIKGTFFRHAVCEWCCKLRLFLVRYARLVVVFVGLGFSALHFILTSHSTLTPPQAVTVLILSFWQPCSFHFCCGVLQVSVIVRFLFMVKSVYPALECEKKNGSEPFHCRGESLGFDVLSFWQWSVSNLATNNLRGHLAEYLVAYDLGLSSGIRAEWDTCDLITDAGTRIEVKSASYIQSWEQDKLSMITFGVAPAQGWDSVLQIRTKETQRNSDVFVFCLIHEKDKAVFDPTNTAQWIFYILPTSVLNEKLGMQKSISLGGLLKLEPAICQFGKINETISAVLQSSASPAI